MSLNFDTYSLARLSFNDLLLQDVTKLANGELFYLSISYEDLSAGTYSLAITTGNSELFIGIDFGCSDKLKTEFYEDATISGGTPLSLLNRDRNSDKVMNHAIVENPTITELGTKVGERIEGTAVNKRIGNNVALSTDGTLLLKPNTTYVVRYTLYNTADVSIIANLFEVKRRS